MDIVERLRSMIVSIEDQDRLWEEYGFGRVEHEDLPILRDSLAEIERLREPLLRRHFEAVEKRDKP